MPESSIAEGADGQPSYHLNHPQSEIEDVDPRQASDAVLIDTTATSPSERVQPIVELARSARRS